MVQLPQVSTTAADLNRNFGRWQDRAMSEPILVTHHGRPRSVLVSADVYRKLGSDEMPLTLGDPGGPAQDAILDHLSQGLVVLDASLSVLRVNRTAATYFKRSPETLVGAQLTDLYPAFHESVKTRIFRRVLRTGESVQFEAPSSVYPDQHLAIHAFPHGEGVAYLFQATADPAIEQMATERDTMRALFEAHGAVGLARLSTRGTFAEIDAPLLAMIGFERSVLMAARLVDIMPVACRSALREALEAVLGGGGPIVLDTELMARDGREVSVTLVLAATRTRFALDGVAVLVTPRTWQKGDAEA